MNNLIYYPTLEPQESDWLKYALIYIDNFSPIVPNNIENELSNEFKKIIYETDLIKLHNPKYNQGDRASTKTLIELENILKFPNQYRDKFNVLDIEKTLKDSSKWNYILYNEKYNLDFKDELIKRNLALDLGSKIITSTELANLFMIFLSEEIAKDNKGVPITDNNYFDNLTTYLRNRDTENTLQKDNFIRNIIQLSLPKDINEIPLDKLIEFRNDTEINEIRIKFNLSLSNYFQSLEDDNYDPQQYLNKLNEYTSLFTKEIGRFFIDILNFSLGASSIASGNLDLDFLKSILEGSVMTYDGISSIKSNWSNNSEKKSARKFITKLGTLR